MDQWDTFTYCILADLCGRFSAVNQETLSHEFICAEHGLQEVQSAGLAQTNPEREDGGTAI